MNNQIEDVLKDIGEYASCDNPLTTSNGVIVPYLIGYTEANLLWGYIEELRERNKNALEVINGYFTEGFDDEYDMLNNIKDKLKGEDDSKEEIQVLSRWYPPKGDKKIDHLKLNDSGLWTGKTDTDLIADKINEIIDKMNGE